MGWNNRVLVVLQENKYKDELKSKWEIVRPEDGGGKHYAAGLAKTGYYKKDGSITRGYPQILTKYDLKWIDENRARIDAAIEAKYEVKSDGVEDVPF